MRLNGSLTDILDVAKGRTLKTFFKPGTEFCPAICYLVP